MIEIYFKTKFGFVPRAQFHTKTETERKKATVAMSPFFHAWKVAINVVMNV